MIDVVSLVTLCQVAIKGGSKVIEKYRGKKLSEAQKELMIAAAKNGEFYILSVDEVPNWVRIERENFCDSKMQDPAIAVKYLDAFKNLCERGYIYHDGGILFRLTSAGFKKARELAAK